MKFSATDVVFFWKQSISRGWSETRCKNATKLLNVIGQTWKHPTRDNRCYQQQGKSICGKTAWCSSTLPEI